MNVGMLQTSPSWRGVYDGPDVSVVIIEVFASLPSFYGFYRFFIAPVVILWCISVGPYGICIIIMDSSFAI